MFSFTFSATTPKPPTIDFLENGRIKHYITCYVYKKSGLLSRERLIEKNQFQIAVRNASIEVDGLFPDRTFSCLESRPHSSNPSRLDFRSRCNRFLMPGLPFLVELDTAHAIEPRSITISLHQRIFVAIGTEEHEHSYTALYVHQFNHPAPRTEGHFRDRDSARPLAYGRRSYLVEWCCPMLDSRHRLPFKSTMYSKTAQGNIECGLSLKVEVDLGQMSGNLASVIHNINYHEEWLDARQDQRVPLKIERSINKTQSPDNSAYSGSRKGSISSSVGTPAIISNHLNNQQYASQLGRERSGTLQSNLTQVRNVSGSNRPRMSPVAHPQMSRPEFYSPVISTKPGDYFGDASIAHQTDKAPEVKLSHGSYSPFNVNLFRTDSNVSSSTAYAPQPYSQSVTATGLARGHKPEKIMLPPASVRGAMSSAFERMQLHHAQPTSPGHHYYENLPTPPPTHPPPAVPQLNGGASPASGSSMTSFIDDGRSQSRQRKTRLSRPPVVLGVSQETVQTRNVLSPEPNTSPSFSTSQQLTPVYDASVRRGSDYRTEIADRDSGFSESSAMQAGPKLGVPVTSTGFAKRKVEPVMNPNLNSGHVVLG